MRILIIEDSKTMQRIIMNVVSSAFELNVDIDVADNGSIAFNLVKENKYDLILTDWNMPVMNGLEFVKKFREEFYKEKTPIFMITTEGGKDEVIIALKAGVNNYIIKPFKQDVLKEKLKPYGFK